MTSPEVVSDLSNVTPGVPPWPRVEFRGEARPEPSERRERYERDFAYLFGASRHDVELVLVVRRYEGYVQASDDKAVFGVELRLRNDLGYETHIVKLGSEEEVGCDATNWIAATRGREMASRIFAVVHKFPLPSPGRVAVIYRDAYTLFGPADGNEVAPGHLEQIAGAAVFTSNVEPESVERAIAHIFTDLHLWFYSGAIRNADVAAAFYRDALGSKDLAKKGDGADALTLWTTNPACLDLRRDALWLFCGRDRPDQDHAAQPARYLDPGELVAWALATGQLPETLVGRSHGDLHARNVLLGVQRSAAQYPAVFDYGGMGVNNVLAWDFAKLETELKVRLLQRLYRLNEAHAVIRRHPSWTWKQSADPNDATTHRAEHLRFFFVFETMLAEATEWIRGAEIAEAWRPPGGRERTGVKELDRLLSLLLRIRQEAALALGFFAGRASSWRDELYFALSVHGLVNARWKSYTEPHRESALVSAGVAAAHAQFARTAVAEQCSASLGPGPSASYRVPLAHAHRLWKAGQTSEGKQLLDGKMQCYAHAVPLIAEHALFRCELGEFALVEEDLSRLSAKAAAFHDEETLTRLGRAFKDRGDESWERSGLPFDKLVNHPAKQFYRSALDAYESAFALSNHYFPGINVAALALLTGHTPRAKEVATRVRKDCAEMRPAGPELYWVFVSEGDAELILRNGPMALQFYRNAIDVWKKGEDQYAVSSYRQLLRLRGPLGADLVGPVLKLFDDHPVLGPIIQAKVTRRIPV
jgi:hypothetical protein